MDQKLAELLRKKQGRARDEPRIDWDERRASYIAAVGDLYNLVAQIFAEPIADGTVQLQRRPKHLTERYVGTYGIDDLILFIGDEQVRFSPRGWNIVGAEGRVDVVGDRAEANLIRRDATWFLVQARQPTLQLARLDESALAEVLNQVMRD